MTHSALRGGHVPGPGDLTGHRAQALSGLKQDHDLARSNMVHALTSDPVTMISLPGGRSYLVPTEVVGYLIAEGMSRD
jgi:hypothetical protein